MRVHMLARIPLWRTRHVSAGGDIGMEVRPAKSESFSAMMQGVSLRRFGLFALSAESSSIPRAVLRGTGSVWRSPCVGGGWCKADSHGWTCCVEQGSYGHRARKATWLYAVGVELPSLKWGTSQPVDARQMDQGFHSAEERRMFMRPPKDMSPEWRKKRMRWLERREAAGFKVHCGPERMAKRERMATPIPFRDLLLSMARSVPGP